MIVKYLELLNLNLKFVIFCINFVLKQITLNLKLHFYNNIRCLKKNN